MFLIVVVDKSSGAIVVAITVTVISWYLIVVIVSDVGSGSIFLSSVVFLVNIIEIETIVLDDGTGAVVVSVVVKNEVSCTVESTQPAFGWYIGIINTLVYWLMYGDWALKM